MQPASLLLCDEKFTGSSFTNSNLCRKQGKAMYHKQPPPTLAKLEALCTRVHHYRITLSKMCYYNQLKVLVFNEILDVHVSFCLKYISV